MNAFSLDEAVRKQRSQRFVNAMMEWPLITGCPYRPRSLQRRHWCAGYLLSGLDLDVDLSKESPQFHAGFAAGKRHGVDLCELTGYSHDWTDNELKAAIIRVRRAARQAGHPLADVL